MSIFSKIALCSTIVTLGALSHSFASQSQAEAAFPDRDTWRHTSRPLPSSTPREPTTQEVADEYFQTPRSHISGDISPSHVIVTIPPGIDDRATETNVSALPAPLGVLQNNTVEDYIKCSATAWYILKGFGQTACYLGQGLVGLCASIRATSLVSEAQKNTLANISDIAFTASLGGFLLSKVADKRLATKEADHRQLFASA